MEIGLSTYSAELDSYKDIEFNKKEFDYPYVWKNIKFNYNNDPSYTLDDFQTNVNESLLTIGYNENNNSYKVQLPFGKVKEHKESIQINISQDDSFKISGKYVLMEVEEYNSLFGKSLTEDKYLGFEKTYYNEENKLYLKAVNYSGNTYRYCIVDKNHITTQDYSYMKAYTYNNFNKAEDFTGSLRFENNYENLIYSVVRT